VLNRRPGKSFLDPLLKQDPASFVLTNGRNQRVVARTLLTAFDSASRKRGLLKHDSLPEENALIIAPSNAIHTFFMRFPIDVAFVSRDGRILKVRSAIPAGRMSASLRAFAVIELPAGALAGAETVAGDSLRIHQV
jgi:uncharacterized membrane protein (UPF0127 family)